MERTVEGRVWIFSDNMNTDLMMPNAAFLLPEDEQKKLVFHSIRPGWSAQVEEGDIIVAGLNFGTGSSRPAARLLRELGIVAIVCESINGLFLRNCINSGVIALSCPGIESAFTEGDVMKLNPHTGFVKNISRKREEGLQGMKLPRNLIEIATTGGIVPLLEEEGYL